jgi:prophage regulatory protein
MTEQTNQRLLSRKDLREIGVQFHRVHLDRLIKAGKFPRPVKIGENKNAWLATEVEAWLDDRIKARDAA